VFSNAKSALAKSVIQNARLVCRLGSLPHDVVAAVKIKPNVSPPSSLLTGSGSEMEPDLRVTGKRVTGSAIWVRVGSGHGSKP